MANLLDYLDEALAARCRLMSCDIIVASGGMMKAGGFMLRWKDPRTRDRSFFALTGSPGPHWNLEVPLLLERVALRMAYTAEAQARE